ncbi:Aspartyl/asparaginyl beta-hydroxylase [Tupaia chinensis]|uniref:Aspartyl/asparaginyl beta-hydroxylase n=1 Tax=Tupaia chinensis TaxID=246437 RepID=L9KK99_TUPCH|nr:Aspartyl/asparaginyl beta-hydroxylase [Tupaia chinensis]
MALSERYSEGENQPDGEKSRLLPRTVHALSNSASCHRVLSEVTKRPGFRLKEKSASEPTVPPEEAEPLVEPEEQAPLGTGIRVRGSPYHGISYRRALNSEKGTQLTPSTSIWNVTSSSHSSFLTVPQETLERNWKLIRDEGLAVMDKAKGLFLPEDENLREKGDWSQFTLWQHCEPLTSSLSCSQ